MKYIYRNALLSMVAIVSLVAANATKATTFFDSEFDLSSYDSQIFKYSDGAVSITQEQTGGNTGPYLNIVTDSPASPIGDWVSRVNFINKSFVYDASTSGGIGAIDMHVDVSATMPQLPFAFLSNETRFIIEQGGNIYGLDVSIPLIQNTYQTAAAQVFSENSFSLVADPIVGSYDTSKHPDFTAGILRFGIAPATFVSNTPVPYELIYNFDNLYFSISSVPESSVLMQLTMSLPLLYVFMRRRKDIGIVRRANLLTLN